MPFWERKIKILVAIKINFVTVNIEFKVSYSIHDKQSCAVASTIISEFLMDAENSSNSHDYFQHPFLFVYFKSTHIFVMFQIPRREHGMK